MERIGAGAADLVHLEPDRGAHRAQLARLHEQPQHVHVVGDVADEDFHRLDDHQPGERVAVEGVEEEETARGEHARRLGDDPGRVLDVLEEVHGADRVEAGVGEGES